MTKHTPCARHRDHQADVCVADSVEELEAAEVLRCHRRRLRCVSRREQPLHFPRGPSLGGRVSDTLVSHVIYMVGYELDGGQRHR